jgi:long-chain acyl-CoA synthetase
VQIRNVPTNIRSWGGETERHGNSIFIFEIGSLCVAHLGHLHHTLTPAGEPDLDWLTAHTATVSPEDPAFIVYTSGTTGHPKGALTAHGKHLAATHNLIDIYPTLSAKEHRTVVYLPLCHVLGRDIAVTLPLISRLIPHFGEDAEDFPATLFETAPTILFTVPRYLQKFASHVLVGIINTSPLKRAMYKIALGIARRHARLRWDDKATIIDRAIYALFHRLMFRPVLNKLGFDHLEIVISGGAPLPEDTMALWHMYGVNVVEMYGQTETAGGIISGARIGNNFDLGTGHVLLNACFDLFEWR